jgi:hypothetical protein
MSDVLNGVADEVLATGAFERVKADLLAFRTEELLQVSLDISAAVATVLGVVPEVRALRAQIVKELPSFEIDRFDKLEDYALALSHAQVLFLSATQRPNDLDPIAEEAAGLRAKLLAEATALVHHGVLNQGMLSQLKGANGYKNTATDVMVLANVLGTVLPQIQGRTLTTAEDLEYATRLGTHLLRIVGLKEQGPAQVAEATELRLRAYTALLLAYDDARRAITFLRGAKDDADTIAPRLHPGRPRSKKGSSQEVPDTGSTAPGTSAVTAPVVGTSATVSDEAEVPKPVNGGAVSARGPFLS